MDEWLGVTTGPLLLVALALVDVDEWFVSCCLRLPGLFGASLAISLDIPEITCTQQKLNSTREKPQEA